MKTVHLYTDGACSGNPGPGGYGGLLIYGNEKKKYSGGYKKTTNNRMELMAIIRGLECLKQNCRVKVHSDSKYVVDSIVNGWADRWKANNWKRNKRDRAENIDLWERLLDLLSRHDVQMIWVKGHSGDRYNEEVNRLAVAASKSENPETDEGYQSG